MTVEEIKQTYSMRDILDRYGIHVNRSSFASCPFHTGDRTPSLKVYKSDFYCFACLFPTAVAERIRFTAKGRTGSHPAEFATIEKSTQSSFFIQCFEFFECLDHYRPRSSPEIYIGNVESVSLCAGKTERKPE